MDQNPIYDTPQSIFHTLQLFEQESSSTIFALKSSFDQLSGTFSKKNPHFNINKVINDSLVKINSDQKSINGNLNTDNDDENIYLNGFPGTQLDSILSLNEVLELLGQYSDSLKKYSRTIESFLIPTDTKTEKKQRQKKQKKSKDSTLSDDFNEKRSKMLLIYNPILGIKEHLTTITPEKERKAQKILKKIDEKRESGHCKPTTAIKVLTELSELRSNHERPELLKKLDEYYIQFHEHMPEIVNSFCTGYKCI